MGQRYDPRVHDPKYQNDDNKNEGLSEEEAELLFEAVIAEMDAEEAASRDE